MDFKGLARYLINISHGYRSFIKTTREIIDEDDLDYFYPQNLYLTEAEKGLELFFVTKESIISFKIIDVIDGGVIINTVKKKDIANIEFILKNKTGKLIITKSNGEKIEFDSKKDTTSHMQDFLCEKIKKFYKQLL